MNTLALDKVQPNKVIHQKKTGNLRFRKGEPNTIIPFGMGLEEEWSFMEGDGVREWREWRPIPVVEHDA